MHIACHSWTYPVRSVRPNVVFKPTTPQREAGIRTEPGLQMNKSWKSITILKQLTNSLRPICLYNLHHLFPMLLSTIQKRQLQLNLRKNHLCTFLDYADFQVYCNRKMFITDVNGKIYTQPKRYPRNNSYQIHFKKFYFMNKGKISKAVCMSGLSDITQARISATQPKKKTTKM